MDVQELNDDQIREILTAHGGPNTPVNSSTRGVLLRKVAQLLQQQQQQQQGAHNGTENQPATVSSDRNGEPSPVAKPTKFESEAEVRRFVMEQQDKKKEVTLISSEKANAFPSLSMPALNKFRKFIECGDLEQFTTTVWENPRHLIARGDTPEILKPPLRYNALHCAVRSGSLPIIKKLFKILEGDRFWSMVYPDDTPIIKNRRRSFLIDLYLNTCDRGMQETPLHFAAKLGHDDIVSFLLSFPALDTKAVNKEGRTAYEVTCANDKNPSSTKKQRILDLLADPAVYFVPVLRAVDNSVCPKLSHPRTLQQLETQQSPTIDKMESPVMNSALAGPMSPLQAKSFYKEWHSPSNDRERKEARHVKRSDPDRGMERVGRHLAHQSKVKWKEYWEFLDCLCDLSEPEGLKVLEDYLSKLTTCSNDSTPSEVLCSSPTDLGELLESKLTLTPKPSFARDCGDRFFLVGSEPTKLDYDVMLALDGCDVDSSVHPFIARWQELVKSFTEEEQKKWRTPLRLHSSKQQRHLPTASVLTQPSYPLQTTPH